MLTRRIEVICVVFTSVYSIHRPKNCFLFGSSAQKLDHLIDINMKIFPKFEPLVCFYDMIHAAACLTCRFGFESNFSSLRLEEF